MSCYLHFCQALYKKINELAKTKNKNVTSHRTPAAECDGTVKLWSENYQSHVTAQEELNVIICKIKTLKRYFLIRLKIDLAFAIRKLNKVAVLQVDLNQQMIICDFKTALLPVIQGYLRNRSVLLATVFLPISQVDTSFNLPEVGTTVLIKTWKDGMIDSTKKGVETNSGFKNCSNS
ncbi:hypothetical protein T11_5052 [Trichinella zimbabwensis]|uniref:Uncharacterized protein n=1 Tax=Trichinella zimbabwensis TaxID=268475 RepID=A0A0V1H644_9BILA|nr:hypothetical protein T11_5052 [Trichinella zimbabwensis]